MIQKDGSIINVTFTQWLVGLLVVLHRQTFRLRAEGLESMAAFIGQGPYIRQFNRHVKQPITVVFSFNITFRGVEMSPQ